MPRSTITETVKKVQGLVDQVNALSEDERAFFLDLLLPEPEQQQPAKTKRTRKKRSASTSASRQKRGLPTDAPLHEAGKDAADLPTRAGLCGICGHEADYQDHFKPSPHYHEFKTTA